MARAHPQLGQEKLPASPPWPVLFPQMQGPLHRHACVLAVPLPVPFISSQPPWKHQTLPSCLKRPLGSHPRHSQALGKALSSMPHPRGSHHQHINGPVVEPSLFLYPLAFLCALAAPRCLQALPRLLPPGCCLISAPIPVSSPLPLEMLPGGTSHLVCSLFLARAVA